MSTDGATAPDTIVLIHGLWMTPRSWENWVDRYTRAGYRVFTPAWPRMEGEVEALRQDSSGLAGLGVIEVADHYDRIIRAQEKPPIIMGHSFGGLVVQLLLDRGLGAAGVAIDSAQTKGVFRLPFAQLRSSLPGLGNPANVHRVVALTPKQFHYAFTNTLSRHESDAVYNRQHVPGPGRPLFQAGLANVNPRAATRVNYRNNERAPLLFIAGGVDHTAPAAVNKENAYRYRRSTAVTDYTEFPGRSHYTLGQDGWEEVADYALAWAARHTDPTTRPVR